MCEKQQYVLNSVNEFFTLKRPNVEKYNNEFIISLKWPSNAVDVLYSFRGVYTIGVFIYYRSYFPDEVRNDIFLKERESGKKQLLYSNEYLGKKYMLFSKVSDLNPMKEYLHKYYDIGNVFPTWPGANVNRGTSHCYDIPDVYYNRYDNFSNMVFNQIYKNAYMDKILASKYNSVEKLLKMSKDEYTEFLYYIVQVIDERTNLLAFWIKENSDEKSCKRGV